MEMRTKDFYCNPDEKTNSFLSILKRQYHDFNSLNIDEFRRNHYFYTITSMLQEFLKANFTGLIIARKSLKIEKTNITASRIGIYSFSAKIGS